MRFERDLAKGAESVKAQKGVALIEHAKALASEHENTFNSVQSIFEERRNSSKDRLTEINNIMSTLEKEHRSLDAVIHEVQELNYLINRHLTEGEIDRLIEELRNDIERCNTVQSENEAIDNFFSRKIGGINTALYEQIVKLEEEYEQRRGDLDLSLAMYLRELLPSYEARELRGAEDSSYDDRRDPYAYVTSNNVWAVLLSFAAATVSAAVVPAGAGAGK